jgi:SAM-dependent methyltransferase
MLNGDLIGVEPSTMCILCDREGEVLYRDLPDRLFGASGLWGFRHCEDCGLLWLDPAPTAEEIHKAYAHYYTHEGGATSQFEQLMARVVYGLLGLLRQRSALRKALNLEDLTSGRVLEIGFGSGRRLEELIERGLNAEGQEVDPVAIRNARARGLRVHEGPLPRCDLPSASYDAIVGVHVIEHVHAPIEVLGACNDLLVPGGTLTIATPNADSYGHRLFGRYWRDLDPPRHLHVFSPAALREILRRAGFTDIQISSSKAHTIAVFATSLRIVAQHSGPRAPVEMVLCSAGMGAQLLRTRLGLSHDLWEGEELVAVAKRSPRWSSPR